MPRSPCSDAGPDAGGPPSEGPERVATAFLDALQQADEPAIVACLTPAAAAAVQAGGDGLSFDGARLESFELGRASVQGSSAELPVAVVQDGESQDLVLLLRRDGAWGVRGVRVPFGEAELALDFEEPDAGFGGMGDELGRQIAEQLAEGMQRSFDEAQAQWEQGGSEEDITARRARFDAVRSLTERDHDAAWRVDVEGGGRPALEVLAELVGPAGLELDSGTLGDTLGAPLDLALEGVSRVEAVERVCAQLGVHPIWPSATTMAWTGDGAPGPEPLTFGEGPRALPAVAAGPFLVEVAELVEDTPLPTGRMTLAVRALGLPPAVLAFGEERIDEMLHLERVRGSGDRPLVDESLSVQTSADVRGGYLVYAIERELTGLLRGVEHIESIAGDVRIAIPATVETQAFERPDAGPRRIGAGTLKVAEWGASTRFELEGETAEGLRVLTSPRRADGQPLGVRFASCDGWGTHLQASLDCPEAPAAVDLKICTPRELRYAFELPPVPLRGFAQRPERLAALEFPGAAPIEVEATSGLRFENGMAEVDLAVHDRSNKDVMSAAVEFAYLDDAGETLEDFPHTLTGDYDFESERTGPLVGAGETHRLTTMAAFAPEETASIRFRVLSLELRDGTTWEATAPQ